MRHSRPVVAAILAISCAAAAHAGERHSISVSAGRLGDALVELGRQTGSSIGTSDRSLTDVRVEAVSGKMSVDDAIRRLLNGKPARAIKVGGSSWRIVADAKPKLARKARPKPFKPKPAPAITKAEPDSSAYEVKEIVVLASKRETLLDLMPATVSVIDGTHFPAGLEAGGTGALVEKLPSLTSTYAGTGRNKLFLRGIADSAFVGPTQATVGQYFGEVRMNHNAPDPDIRLYDLDNVEIIEGPQGTLYGAGSLGGIIRINPRSPELDRLEAFASYAVSLTEKGSPSADGHMVVNLPVVDNAVGIRLLTYAAREGGYVDDPGRLRKDINTTDIVGGRASMRVSPSTDWEIELGGLGQTIRSGDAQYAQRSLPGLSRKSPMAQKFASDYWLGNLHVRGNLGGIQLVSSVGIVDHDLTENYDATRLRNAPMLFTQKNRVSLFSTEHRVTGYIGDKFDWLLGASFARNRSRLSRGLTPASMAMPSPGVENRISEWAVFGDASVALTDKVILSFGGRYSSSRLSGSVTDVPLTLAYEALIGQAKRTEHAFLPALALKFLPREDIHAYVRYQQGFRPGGLVIDGANVRYFRNDRSATLEGGVRFGNLDRRRFVAAATIAYTDWRDIQADITDGSGFPTTANIGDGRVVSVEGQLSLQPTDSLSIDSALIYSWSHLDSPSQQALAFIAQPVQTPPAILLALPNVTKFGGRLAATYRRRLGIDSEFTLSGSLRYIGKSRLGIGPAFDAEQGGYVQTGISAKLENDRYAMFLNATNLLGTVGNRFSLGTPFALPDGDEFTPLRPRTISLGFSAAF
jgi:iron complex outermembrane recepter protein